MRDGEPFPLCPLHKADDFAEGLFDEPPFAPLFALACTSKPGSA